ncbi:MAG: Dabb family protein [Clostridia bacterium]|nr:Dabb family protein [Clostridia bacterium]
MIKHVILWNLKDEFSDEQKAKIKSDAKRELEALKGKIPGLIDIKLNITGLASSNADMMLDSSFESEDALKNYATHPDHVAAADNFVRPFTKSRSCLDYIE